ncbi:MAG: redox-sensing transcriptional repressor Rex [Armatimonadetes bacterium]|nr:redox-sensing transcriptional repressor Rex [Armatimonadota bacterium]
MRLRWYLQALAECAERGVTTVSSDEIGQRVGVKPNLVRSDLSWFGEFGTRSRGYDVAFLSQEIRRICHLGETGAAIWVGLRLLLEQPRTLACLEQCNWRVVSIIDWEGRQVGARIGRRKVQGRGDIADVVKQLSVQLGVVATEADDAQAATDALVDARVHAILNLTPAVLTVPERVQLRDACAEDAIFALSYYGKAPAGSANGAA